MKETSKLQPNSFLLYLILLIISVLIFSWIFEYLSVLKFHHSNDTYFEDASNFLSGRGISRTPWGIYSINRDLTPTGSQPPGYGILISFVSFVFSWPVIGADLWLSRISYILLLPVITFTLNPLIGKPASLFCALLVITTPGLYKFGFGPYSEPVYVLFLTFSIGLVIRGIQSDENNSKAKSLLFCAGILASAAYSIRNAGIAYYLSFYSALIISSLLHILKVRTAFITFLYFSVGSLPILILLFWRNISLFNQILPYQHNKGYFATLITSFRVFLEATFLDFSGSLYFSKIAWDIKLLVLLGLPTFFLFLFLFWNQWKMYSTCVKFFIVFSILCFLSTGSMLIIAHSFYGLDPGDLVRHVTPLTWLIFPFLTVALNNVQAKFFYRKYVPIIFGLTLLFLHILYIQKDIRNSTQILQALEKSDNIALASQPLVNKYKIITPQLHLKLSEDKEILNYINAIPQDALILSNASGLLRRLTDRSIRGMDFNARSLDNSLSEIEKLSVQVGKKRMLYIVILPSNDIVRMKNAELWKETIIEKFPEGFTLTRKNQNIIIFKKNITLSVFSSQGDRI